MWPPSPFSALPPVVFHLRLALKLFRGEPAISKLDWNFSAIHKSSPPFSKTWVRASTVSYHRFTLFMDRSLGFGSIACNSFALFRLGFPAAPVQRTLTLLHTITRRSVLQKVRGRILLMLPLLVNTGFQVLFHSPSGVLFTFPSRYYTLSVTKKYLALGGGPPCFPRDFSCPVVLWIPAAASDISLTGLSPSLVALSIAFQLCLRRRMPVHNPEQP